ncbi:MAG: tyrosine-type recombinase/integrase [Nitriliruptoraceae bacterium]|nr:tyrosine-type recombinase/integrase [Nitriliruptoraceae bacterium]
MNHQRQGSVFRRCTTCGTNLTGQRRDGAVRADLHAEGPCEGTRSSWAYVVDVNAPGAPREQRRAGGFATKAEALEAATELQRTRRDGTHVEPSKLTLGAYLDGWLEVVRSKRAPATYEARRHHIAYVRHAGIADIPVQSLTEQHVEQMAVRLAESGRLRGEGGLSARSIKDVCTTLTTALNDAVRQRLIQRNVAEGARRGEAATQGADKVFAWTADELRQWLDAVADDELGPLWRFLAFTGARRGEALAIRDRDIDLAAGTATINRAAGRDLDGELAYRPPKTARGRRTIDLDAETVRVLREARQSRTVVALGASDSRLAFTLPDGEPVSAYGLRARFATTVKRAKVPRITPHGLRHTHASLLLASGVPLHVVSRRLGHANEAFTAKTYAHVLNGQGAEAAAKLAGLIDREAQ